MALTTYMLLSAIIAGSQGQFDPSILGQTASKSFGLLFIEFVCIKLGCYLLGIGEEGAVLDLVAYEGYKFVGIIVTLLAGLAGAKGWLFWTVFLYVFLANFFFLVCSLSLPLRSCINTDEVYLKSYGLYGTLFSLILPCRHSTPLITLLLRRRRQSRTARGRTGSGFCSLLPRCKV